MAVRGVALITGTPGWQEEGRVDVYFTYKGFTHVDEDVGGQVGVTPSLLTGSALKAAIKSVITQWYDNHPSENYDEWNDLLDSYTLIGGVL